MTSITIKHLVELDLESLAHALADDLTHEELAEFVRGLDQVAGDWSFSRLLIALGERLASELEAEDLS